MKEVYIRMTGETQVLDEQKNLNIRTCSESELIAFIRQTHSLTAQATEELIRRIGKYTGTLSDINTEIPEVLTGISGLLESADFSISNPKNSQKQHLVIIDGVKNYYTETQVVKLREKNDANMLLDIPRLTLTVRLPKYDKKFDFEKFPHPSQKILEWAMTYPGEIINKEKFWDTETLKRYIFTTRQLLNDNKEKHIIKTSKALTVSSGSYYLNPRLKFIVIKNLKSTQHPPAINNVNLK